MAELAASPPVPPRGRRGRPSTLETLPAYYHPCVTNLDEVKKLMVQYVGKEGAFIIRNSFSRPGSYTASVMHGEGIKHFNILRNGSYFFVQDERFNSIEDVVTYFSSHEVPNQEGVKHVMLRYPIPCNQCNSGSSESTTPQSARAFNRSTSDLSSNMFDMPHSASSVTLPANMKFDNISVASSTDDSTGMVCLPSPPNKTPSPGKKGRFSNIFNFHKHKNHVISKTDRSKRLVKSVTDSCLDISNRPPCPLPASTHPSQNNPSALDYEEVRNTEVNRLPELLRTLRMSSEQGMEKCECGLTIEESELPGGWSMHISHDENTRGRLFFMGPRGETSWNMPLEVSLDLCADDQDRIKQVKAKCDDLQQQYRAALSAGIHSGAQDGSELSTGSFSNSAGNTSVDFQQNGGQQNGGFSMTAEDGASGDSVPSSISRARPMQHNEYTGSTTGMSPGISSASMPITAGY